MLVQHATHPQFLSNTYLVADGVGGPAFFVDAGGPVEPLIAAAERLELTPTHVLLTHHHFDHVSEVGKLRERWPKLEVLISDRERQLLEGGVAGAHDDATGAVPPAKMGSIEAGQTLRFGELELRPLHTPGHTAGMLSFLVGERPHAGGGDGVATRSPRSIVPGGLAGSGLVVFTGDTLFKDSVGGVRAPGHTTYTDLRDSIMGTLMELPPDTVIYPGHCRAEHRRPRVGLQRVHPRLAGSRPARARSCAPRSASPPRWCCSAPTTTAAPRRGCAGRTAPTTSFPARAWSRRASKGPLPAARPAPSMRGMARENEKIPTSRARRTATVATLAASEAVKQFGTRAANVTRGEDASEEAMARRQLETAKQIVAVLGTMKGAAMKLGQVMSFLDVGLVPEEHREEFQHELAKLRDAAPTVSFKQMRA